MTRETNTLRQELLRTIGNMRSSLTTAIQTIAADLAKVNAKMQRVHTSAGPLAIGTPVDVTITWDKAWPDTGYGVWVSLETGNAALGNVHGTLKAGSKTTTDCVVTVSASVVVATVGVDVLGVRT